MGDEIGFDGRWMSSDLSKYKATIKGETLWWRSGTAVRLERIEDRIRVTCHGGTSEAQLINEGTTLKWDDGDIWTRQEPPTHTFVPVVWRRRTRMTHYQAGSEWSYQQTAPCRMLGIARGTSNAQISQQLTTMTAAMLQHSGDPELAKLEYKIVHGTGQFLDQQEGKQIPSDGEHFVAAEKETLCVDFDDADGAKQMKDRLPTVNKLAGSKPGGTTLEDCLRKNAEREQLSETDSAYCRKCKEFRCQFKTLSLWTLPEVLIVHLKRFGRDSMQGPLVKIDCPVTFQKRLDLSRYISRQCPEGSEYEIYGVVNHSGSVAGGHYTAHAKVTSLKDMGEEDGECFHFNDSTVSKASESDLDSEAAYVLFYRRLRRSA